MDRSLEELLKSLEKINRTDFLETITLYSWHLYRSDEKKTRDSLLQLLKAFGNRIACFSSLVSSDSSSWMTTITDLHLYLDWYLDIADDDISMTDEKKNSYVVKLKENSDFEKLEFGAFTQSLGILIYMSKQLRIQWSSYNIYGRSADRNVWITQRFFETYPDVEFRKIIEKRSRLYNQMDLVDVIRNAYSIYAISTLHLPGVILVENSNKLFDIELAEYNIDFNTYQILIRNWSWTRDELLNELNSGIKKLSIDNLKYIPSFLVKRPFIFNKASNQFYIPSPWDFLKKIETSSYDFFSDILNKNELGQVLRGLGDCYSEWMILICKEILGSENVICLDPYREKAPAKIADTILIEGDTAIIIEFKRSLGSIFDQVSLNPSGLSDIFSRIHSAFKQIDDTYDLINKGFIPGLENVKNISYVVCTNQSLIQEAALYLFFAKSSGLYKNLQSNSIAVFDSNEFEDYIFSFNVRMLHQKVTIAFENIEKDLSKSIYSCDRSKFSSSLYKSIQKTIWPNKKGPIPAL